MPPWAQKSHFGHSVVSWHRDFAGTSARAPASDIPQKVLRFLYVLPAQPVPEDNPQAVYGLR